LPSLRRQPARVRVREIVIPKTWEVGLVTGPHLLRWVSKQHVDSILESEEHPSLAAVWYRWQIQDGEVLLELCDKKQYNIISEKSTEKKIDNERKII